MWSRSSSLAAVDWVPYRPDEARWRYDRADSWLNAGAVDKAAAEAEIMLGLDYSYYMPFRLGHAFAARKRPELAARLRRFPCRVNLIPLSPVEEFQGEAPPRATMEAFLRVLERNGLEGTLRESKGKGLDAACGQLRRRTQTDLL